MVDLIEKSAFSGAELPFVAGGLTLDEAPIDALWSVSPYAGAQVPLDLQVGRCGQNTIWAGADMWFTTQAPPDLTGIAAVTEQGDGWVALDLTGDGWGHVLARICPVDPMLISQGVCVRTDLGHMFALIIGLGRGVRIMGMRSFAHSLHHELVEAMQSQAARQRM
ncbi:Sarcosine oxidase, gamma subunit family [Monaibacterium marinum]|uniref:Sarcosine oxidase, gamma subunit family n=1 Tax=Pontivivens marinum TaxID=1690039 RepID=A0A2C9CMZ9_9RHOB|nr:hypothetical protein [Monaibacterium marinum]SOH92575.1 Sarcosine oxidase, gamma subunit family [Monaibacterium marinum]